MTIKTLASKLKRRSFFRPWLDNTKSGSCEFYTIEHVEFCLAAGIGELKDDDPYRQMLNEFIQDTTRLWAALLDGSLNDNQDELIESLIFAIVTKDENSGRETHPNIVRHSPSYQAHVRRLIQDDGMTVAQAMARADYVDDRIIAAAVIAGAITAD